MQSLCNFFSPDIKFEGSMICIPKTYGEPLFNSLATSFVDFRPLWEKAKYAIMAIPSPLQICADISSLTNQLEALPWKVM